VRPVGLNSLLLVLTAASGGCARHQPEFVEPAWGDAPAPYPSEVVEITYEHRHCGRNASACSLERVVLRRDGRATRIRTHPDSLETHQVGTVDSLTFVSLAARLSESGFFHRADGYARHEPLRIDSYIITAASFCRRAVQGYTQPDAPDSSPPRLVETVRVAVLTIPWAWCCRARVR
jgi:hypothetical protein